jgi:alpha-galactosidase
MPNLVLIGAGSIIFARRLLIDVLSYEELREGTISLVDLDEERLAAITAWLRAIVAQHELPVEVQSSTDRREVLEGADVVITSIAVGGEDAWRADSLIPQRYGIEQQVGDTLGPGGVFRALRTVPSLLEIGEDVGQLCPEAWMLNYTNPMAICTWAVNAATKARMVGLCHSVQGTAHQLAGYMQVPYGELDYWVAGINHMAWYLRLERNGQSLYPRLREVMDDPEVYRKDVVRFEILRHFDYFVTESTWHMSEYVPYFLKDRECTRQFGLRVREDRTGWTSERWQKHVDALRQEIASSEPLPLKRSEEYASKIIHALTTGEPCRINGNVLNEGLIDNLPQGCCVEVPCLVQKRQIAPCHVGPLPEQLAALNRANVAVQALAVEAILERDLRKAYHAVAVDPLTAAVLTLGDIRSMFDEMVEAEKGWLQGYR